MARRSRSRQVEIFNFSFLDILACTIGLLIFIMVMVFILQSGSPVADTTAMIQRAADEAHRNRTSAQQDNVIATQLQQQLSRIRDTVKPELRTARDVAANQSSERRAEYEQTLSRLHEAENELATALAERQRKNNAELQQAALVLKEAEARNKAAKAAVVSANAAPVQERLRFLPKGNGAEDLQDHQVLHLDCEAEWVVLVRPDSQGNLREAKKYPVSSVDRNGSAFQQLIEQQARLSHPLVLLWVRPDGIDTFHKVSKSLTQDLEWGYEPADSEWHFTPRQGQ